MKSRHSDLDDNDLFHAFQEDGKEKDAAFVEIYARYAQKVYVYCLRMTGDSDDANDIFQETFARFYRHAFRLGERIKILPYLLASARHVFLNERRSSSRWSPFNEDFAVSPAPPYERDELFNMVGSALELLDVPYREAFILRFYEGLSYKEMSDITGDTVSALKIRVMRAKDRIRMILSPYIADISQQHE